MAEKTRLEYDRLPSIAPTYVRAVIGAGSGLSQGETIPRIEAHISGLDIDRRHLAGYRKVCGFAERDVLPVTYPHVLAFPMHMAVLTHREFPLRLLGLVHTRNEITQHRGIGVDEKLDIEVFVDGHREVHNGNEFDLTTELRDGESTTVWHAKSTMLSRGKGSGGRRKKKSGEDDGAAEFGRYANWDAPADIGRRYAASAGDYNPIHLSAISAKLFGFPCAIAHGMWSKARAAAEMENELKQNAYTIKAAFKRPVLLPSPVVLKYQPDDKGIEFVLMNPDGETNHMQGAIVYRGEEQESGEPVAEQTSS